MSSKENCLIIDNNICIPVFNCKDSHLIPWTSCNVEVVAECSGVNLTQEKCLPHFQPGVKKVVLSAPAKDENIPMIVMGVNHSIYNQTTRSSMNVVSNASCTTNCLAPLAKVVNSRFGITEGLMTTIHSITASQLVVDGPSKKDWRAGRCSSLNIIPSTTG